VKKCRILLAIILFFSVFTVMADQKVSAATSSGFLKNKSKVYVLKDSKGVTYTESFLKTQYGWNNWKTVTSKGERYVNCEKQTRGALLAGWPESEYIVPLKFPLKTGLRWSDGYEGDETYYRITSTNKTVKTPAGTFTHCIEVKNSYGTTSYYKTGIGFVKSYYKGVYTQLIKIRNR
jgi:hypothetical protein